MLCLLLLPLSLKGQQVDTVSVNHSPDLHIVPAFKQLRRDSTLNLREKIQKSGNIFKRFIKAFDEYDTTFIEPNRYHWTTMLQGTGNAEWFSLWGEDTGNRLRFTSRPGYKIGPYLGWHWLFLGYTVDVRTLGKAKTSKTELELSLYSSMLGADLLYRKTGSDFTLRRAIGYDQDLSAYYGSAFDGISISLMGINAYYILNHRHFSLPAAYSQSTRQLKSAGSWKFGFSVTRHTINIDYNKLNEQIPGGMSADMDVSKTKYMDYSLSAGYAYNWVFAKNWLFNIDVMPAVGYKRTSRDIWGSTALAVPEASLTERRYNAFFVRGNVNFNMTGRFGLVWNDGHHYAGASLVFHNFNYRYDKLSMHNTFFTLNLYTGINFWRKK